MDIVTYSLAKNKAKKYTDEVVEGLGRGILYKGAVNYYNDLPGNAAIGDCYSVLYEGTSGSTPSGAEYIWGKVNDAAAAEWIQLGKDIDLTDYVKNTDYASDNKAGVIKSGYGLLINASGNPYADIRTYDNYLNVNNNLFISKGTLENVITGKGLVSNTDYATDSVAGVLKTDWGTGTYVNSNNGKIQARAADYATYNTLGNGTFIGKGTLDNVLTATIGDIASVIDAINGESI